MKRIYLSSPYWDENPQVREYRFQQACIAAAYLIKQKNIVFSPIAHSHPINGQGLWKRSAHGLWMIQDLPLVKWADEFCILHIPGWHQSKGIGMERRYAEWLGKPISFLIPDYYEKFHLTTSQPKQ